MTAPHSPPPGAAPGAGMSPDVSAMMEQFQASQAGGTAADPGSPAGAAPAAQSSSQASPQPPQSARPLGAPHQEVQYFAGDVAKGLLSHLPAPLRSVLNISPDDSPEQQQRKQRMLNSYQQMQAEQQQYVHQKMAQVERQKQQEEELAAQQRQKAAQASEGFTMPAGKVSGAGAKTAGQSQGQAVQSQLSKNRKMLVGAG